MTSVEWLEDKLSYDNGFGKRFGKYHEGRDLFEFFEKSKEMHKREQDNISAQRYMDGYNKAKETLHIKEQVSEATGEVGKHMVNHFKR